MISMLGDISLELTIYRRFFIVLWRNYNHTRTKLDIDEFNLQEFESVSSQKFREIVDLGKQWWVCCWVGTTINQIFIIWQLLKCSLLTDNKLDYMTATNSLSMRGTTWPVWIEIRTYLYNCSGQNHLSETWYELIFVGKKWTSQSPSGAVEQLRAWRLKIPAQGREVSRYSWFNWAWQTVG